jgi:hypothetical protein
MLFVFVCYWQHLTRRVTWRMFYKKQEQLTIREHLGSTPVFRWCVANLFYMSSLCVLFNVACVTGLSILDCPYLIVPSIFSNVYLHENTNAVGSPCCVTFNLIIPPKM